MGDGDERDDRILSLHDGQRLQGTGRNMTALLGLISTKDLVYGGIIAAILAGGIWYHHKLITEGVADQLAADTVASDKLQAEAAKQTADLQARATAAEQAYDKEQNDDAAYRSAHPIQPVRLCLGAPQTGGRRKCKYRHRHRKCFKRAWRKWWQWGRGKRPRYQQLAWPSCSPCRQRKRCPTRISD
jgi:hypothetical protein